MPPWQGEVWRFKGKGQKSYVNLEAGNIWAPEAGGCVVCGAPGLLLALEVTWLAGCHDYHFITMCQAGQGFDLLAPF